MAKRQGVRLSAALGISEDTYQAALIKAAQFCFCYTAVALGRSYVEIGGLQHVREFFANGAIVSLPAEYGVV